MKGTEFQAPIRRHLLPRMPGFDVKGGVLFARPLRYIVRGYCFESSGFDKRRFCVWAFAQPLFVLEDGIVFDIGGRLGNIFGTQEEWWTLADGNEKDVMDDVWRLIQREGATIVDKFKTLEDFAKNTITRRTNSASPYPPEMVAYSAVLLGNTSLAEEMFDKLEWTLRDESDRQPYEEDILKRARLIREAFARDPRTAVAALNDWRDQTAENLKLTRFLDVTAQPADS